MRQVALICLGIGVLASLSAPAPAFLTTVWSSGDYNTVVSNAVITVPTFDTQGGRFWLTGVTVQVYHEGWGTFAVENDSRGNHQWQVQPHWDRDFTVAGPGVSSNAVFSANGNPATIVDRADNSHGPPDYNPPSGYNWGRVGYGNTLNSTSLVGSSFLSQYQGSGGGSTSFAVSATDLANSLNWITGPPPHWSQLIGNGNPNLRVSIRVDYDWGAVPEPSTWLLMAVGLAGVGCWARRRRRAG
jgi:hypothetical protein